MKVNIIQEDDSTIEGMVVNYDPTSNQHHVVVGLNTPEQAGDDVPLAEYPDAYEVSFWTWLDEQQAAPAKAICFVLKCNKCV